MNVNGLGEIKAVAFDIDGTLYAPWRLNIRAIFRYVRHGIFFLHYGLVRNKLHGKEVVSNFFDLQAEHMANSMRTSKEHAHKKLNDIVYKGMEKYFARIKCFPNVPETFKKFKEAGFKIGLLSDFPPEQKGDIWGVKQYCDVILGTEELGALKPSPYSFIKMAEMLGVEPSEILYVGNSRSKDVVGSKKAGMKSAYLLSGFRKIFNLPIKEADISFSNYRQLQEIVLK
ncbi:MAG: HAD family hydrolase [Treponema sp.]|nr:HAD family hydrolase [Treponema sp.]